MSKVRIQQVEIDADAGMDVAVNIDVVKSIKEDTRPAVLADATPVVGGEAYHHPSFRQLLRVAVSVLIVGLVVFGILWGTRTPKGANEQVEVIGASVIALGSAAALVVDAARQLANGATRLSWSTTMSTGAIFLGSVYLLFVAIFR